MLQCYNGNAGNRTCLPAGRDSAELMRECMNESCRDRSAVDFSSPAEFCLQAKGDNAFLGLLFVLGWEFVKY